MPKRFRVTGLGLKIDRAMIMPGSDLLLNAEPPSHWQRFGESMGNVSERKLEVATPARTVEEQEWLDAPAVGREIIDDEPEQKPKRRGRPKKVDESSEDG